MNFKIKKIFFIMPLMTIPFVTTLTCCSNNSNVYSYNFEKDSQKIAKSYNEWINKLSYTDWEKNDDGKNKNAICKSEQQSLYMYLNQWGDFWNKFLHLQQEPKDTKRTLIPNSGFLENVEYEINGNGYKYIISALEKAETKFDMQVFHGVEFMEVEFWDQLNKYVKNGVNGLDFSKTIGQKIESYGFLSTTLDIKYAYPFVNGNDWTDNNISKPPLKEPTLFIINIKKNTKEVAYVSGYNFMDVAITEDQVLINKNKQYLIKDWYKDDKGVNIFTLDML